MTWKIRSNKPYIHEYTYIYTQAAEMKEKQTRELNEVLSVKFDLEDKVKQTNRTYMNIHTYTHRLQR